MTFEQYLGDKARAEAMARADMNADMTWREFAFQIVQQVARVMREFTTDEVLDRLDGQPVLTHEMRALGPVMTRAQKAGYITPTEKMVKSHDASRHCALKRVWQSNLYQDKKDD